ncbi:MAG: HyaD/HybD family hydrogenase maturation endopeptidase [Campylobacter sp.]|nr:HyaD/HybD family hydrogenase maturation endopeptidase [Campylobacter sp.]
MKLLVLGIGNVMFSDEGIGVHFAKMLQKNYTFKSDKHSIEFIDGGTLANLLMPILAEFDEILLIDCIDADDSEIGDVYFFDYEVMPNAIKWSGSAHEIEMLQTLQMMELCGDMPKTHILGVVPKRIEPMSFVISDELQKSSQVMEKQALNFIASLGFSYEKIANFSVQDIANEFEKTGI